MNDSAAPLILVVDDDDRIREATAAALEDLGYTTLLAADGAAGLALIEERSDISMVVSDVLMPTMSGPDMVKAVKAQHPDLPIIFMSGDTGCYDAPDFAGHILLCKPFTLPALADAVDAALGGVPAAI
jgi:CheY-like chemotaxis protein